MTELSTQGARTEVERDTFGRPLVVPPTGGPKTPYTRCTTFVGAVEDYYLLGKWQRRHTARGVAHHQDLIDTIKQYDPDQDRQVLDELVDEAMDRSGAGDSARLGTYLHAVTEAADRGADPGAVELPRLTQAPRDPAAYVPDLAAYLAATEDLTAVQIEQFTVLDDLKIGGTPDRVVKYQGKRYIADLKTGKIEWGILKIAAQLAVYARSRPYDIVTDERLAPHGAEVDRGIIIHLPAGSATCRLYWVDLMAGWDAVLIARDMRAVRKKRWAQLVRELRPVPVAPPLMLSLADQVKTCLTPDAVRQLWREHTAEWTDDLTELARQHIAALQQQGTPPPERQRA